MRSTGPEAIRPGGLSRGLVVATFVAAAVCLLPVADLSVSGHDPGAELLRLAAGLARPDFSRVEDIARAVGLTVAFAVAGVAAGGLAGLALAPFYHFAPVRWAAVAVRSVHELFWALMLMQVTGLSVTTGVAAIALPYAGIFAKVFSEALEEADQRPSRVLDPRVDPFSRFLFARLPLAAPAMRTYTLYRLECGLRSSAVLGFIGLPTLGFQLDSFFRQGIYGAVAAILIVTIVLIASIRWWMRPRLALLWLFAAVALLASVRTPPMGEGALLRFLTVDLVPAPFRRGEIGDPTTWVAFGDWSLSLLAGQILPGVAATLIVAQLAVVLAGAVAFFGFPLIVPRVVGRVGAALGHLLLVVLRSIPEYMLAYLFLQILGPSMLPAVLALGLHNGAIIGHLVGRQAHTLCRELRPDAPFGANLWGYELAPRVFGNYLALVLYRWEIIVRESAIVGMLGVATLGFFIDSAIAEMRLDRAAAMLVATGLLTAGIDALSRAVRGRIGAGAVRRTDGAPAPVAAV